MKPSWAVIDRNDQHRIVFLQDISDQTGGATITNSAESVLDAFQGWRVVYQATDQEWWEISFTPNRSIRWTPWSGLAWELLKS
jgi:hypothetical protein